VTARRAVSVVVCCYTQERWDDICGALESVRQQVSDRDEIIVAVDHEPELAARVRASFPDVKVVENALVRGLSGARNTGIAVATREIVAFLDDDAIAADGWLDHLCAPYDDPAVAVVGGRVEPSWDESRPAWFPPEFDWVVGCTYAGHPGVGPIRNVIGANMSFRREIFEALGGFDDRVGRVAALPAGCEETELCIRVRQRRPGSVVWYAPSSVVRHRVRPERATFAYFKARCRAEGGSKTRVARLVGARDGLASERSYATRTLPRAAADDLRVAIGLPRRGTQSRRRGALARVGARACGVALTAGGFAKGRVGELRARAATTEDASPFRPALVGQVDLAIPGAIAGGTSITGDPYERAVLLVRDHGRPCGAVEVALGPDGLSAPAVEQRLHDAIARHEIVVTPRDEAPVSISTPWMPSRTPRVTVVVATRDRPAELVRCVDSILACDYPDFDVLIVDNAPSSVVQARPATDAYPAGPRVTWTREETPGLAVAHNRALSEVSAPIVAFTDDDVVVDPQWLANLVAGFTVAPDVSCVTGMIFPLELETAAQDLVERSVGFNKGFERRIYRDDHRAHGDPLFPYAAGRFGSGANMAFRTEALRAIGGFDSALGTGTRARGGDDLASFFDIVAAGDALVYEPAAIVFHAHRRDDAALARQAFGYGAGLTAYLTKTITDRPSRVFDIAGRVPAGLRYALASDSGKNAGRPDTYSRALVRRERVGMLLGPVLYGASRYSTRRQRRLPAVASGGVERVDPAVSE
jgi:GT2 family glycosyltransferase